MRKQISVLMAGALMLACLMLIHDGLADTIVRGRIGDAVWVPEGNDYLVVDDAWLEDEDDLVIQPGVIIKFSAGMWLELRGGSTIVAGSLESQDQVVFTSVSDDPHPGDWGRIYLHGDPEEQYRISAEFYRCIIKYAGYHREGADEDGAIIMHYQNQDHLIDLTIEQSEIDSCTGWAIWGWGGMCNFLSVASCYIHNNDNGIGIYDPGIESFIMRSTISNNGSGVYLHGFTYPFHVENNLFTGNEIGIETYGIGNYPYIYNNVLSENGTGISLMNDSDADYFRNNVVVDGNIGIQGVINATILYHCVYGNQTNYVNAQGGTGSFSSDPRFAGGGDFHLTYISPCINTGAHNTPNDPDDSWNDMGIYGGTYAWDPYYVLIPADVNDFNIFLQYSTYLVMPDIQIDDEDVLELEAGTTLLFDDVDLGITVNSGGTLMAPGTSEHEITLKAYENAPYWTGVLLTENSSDGSVLKHLSVDNAVNGIICENVTLESPIEESDFTNCNQEPDSKGVYLDNSNTRVHHNSFSQCKIGVGMNNSEAVVDSNQISVEDYGIYTRGGSTWELRYNVMQHYVAENEGIHLVNAGGKLIGNQISEVCNGLYVENSDPKMKDNLIDGCGLYGMHLISASQPVMNFAQYHAANRIADCDSNEIHISGYLYPLIGEGYNDMIDATPVSGDYFIIYGTVPDVQYSYDVGHNYWYLNDPGDIRARLYPPDSPPDYQITVSSWCTSSNTGYTDSWEEDLIAEGIAYEMNDQFSEAYALYLDIVADYPNNQVAITAIRRMFICAAAIGSAYINLYDDYLLAETTITDIANRFNLDRMEGNALRASGSYSEALDLFDELLWTISNITDSVFVLMDIENTEYEMSQGGGGISSLGSSFETYTARMKELLLLLNGSADRPLPSGAIPISVALLSSYPNPFNPITMLCYSLPEAAFARLTICDVQGRFVVALDEGWQEVGIHNIPFNASELSSGIFFCYFQAGHHSASQKLVLIK